MPSQVFFVFAYVIQFLCMEELFLELWKYFMPILIAAVVGGLIGIEREYHDKSAGFRTMILIAVGSSLFTLLSGALDVDSQRIAAAVVSGIGFLGAGVIMKDGANIGGITTAATIWLVAALGMASATGMYSLVIAVTALSLIVLWLLPPFERWIDRLHEFVEIKITIKNTDKAEDNILDIFEECNIKVAEINRSRDSSSERNLRIKAKMNTGKRRALGEILVVEKGVIAFKA